MKILLTEQQILNIVSSQELDDIKLHQGGQFSRWHIEKNIGGWVETPQVYVLEYIYKPNGELKDKFKSK
jgi:hypothetical protein